MLPFAGKTALVTGASVGIGHATALALAAAGADVAVNFLTDSEAAAELAGRIHAHGRRAALYPVDVADQAAVEDMVERVTREFGGIDVLIANAAHSDEGLFHAQDMAAFRRTVDVTMWGTFYSLRAVAARMIQRGRGGSVVVVSSVHAVQAFPVSMAYNMAKAAVDQMARTAALELARHRIRVNVIYPGWTDTPGERKFFSEETLRRAGAALPLGRLARPDEIARGILFLADPASEYVTGSTLAIDGGTQLPWWSRRGTGEF